MKKETDKFLIKISKKKIGIDFLWRVLIVFRWCNNQTNRPLFTKHGEHENIHTHWFRFRWFTCWSEIVKKNWDFSLIKISTEEVMLLQTFCNFRNLNNKVYQIDFMKMGVEFDIEQ